MLTDRNKAGWLGLNRSSVRCYQRSTLVLLRRGIALVRELSIAAGGVTCMVIDRVEAWFDEGEVAQLKPRNLS